MQNPIRRYTHWLHTQWPAGHVEKLPVVRADGSTNVPGVYVAGDLAGVPLLKFSADTGTRAVRTIARDPAFARRGVSDEAVLDVVIIGCGVAGLAAAMEARRAGLRFEVVDASEPLATISNFPLGKPIYTYPTQMKPVGDLQFTARANTREGLLAELRERMEQHDVCPRHARVTQVTRREGLIEAEVADGRPIVAHRAIVAIGRSGNYRRLAVPGEDRDKVYHRLYDPADHHGQRVLVVGGGDSALETAIALTRCGAQVTLSYRKPEFSRPKPDNLDQVRRLAADPRAAVAVEDPSSERVNAATGDFVPPAEPAGRLDLRLATTVREVRGDAVDLADRDGDVETIPNDVMFSMIGREAPLDFFRRSGIRIHGEWRGRALAGLALVLLAFTFVYHWKKPGTWLPIGDRFVERGWFPYNVPAAWESLGAAFRDPAHILGTLRITVGEPGFYYSAAYCLVMLVFGIRRIRRRRTPYVAWQTWTLVAVQWVPLFFLPYVLLPWIGNNGWFDAGPARWFADQFFPDAAYGHGREYWRAFGFILAWPLFFWNVFTRQPLWGWLAVSFVQTFVIIPWMVRRWGKGAYCGWICSCGGMAETLGDGHRHKMPHGPAWNRLNMIGQAFLAIAFVILLLRVGGWAWPGSVFEQGYTLLFSDIPVLNYTWFVDLLFAGILGLGLYFHFSGRTWCRFACPLAALMNVYARFSRFRILANKKKCISCNLCTSVCHQGIDIMSFANKGLPMADPQCVRCSACVQVCPTGVLEFGRVDRRGNTAGVDPAFLAASPVRMTEAPGRGDNRARSRTR